MYFSACEVETDIFIIPNRALHIDLSESSHPSLTAHAMQFV